MRAGGMVELEIDVSMKIWRGADASVTVAVATALVDFHRVAICYDKLAALLPVLALATAVHLSPSINPRSDFRRAYAARH